jgi:hypothetical protein
VNRRQQVIRRRRDYRERTDRIAVRVLLSVVQSRHREETFTLDAKMLWESGFALFPPFVEPTRWHETSACLERVPESWLTRNRLAAGVDHAVPDLNVFGPKRDQTPTHFLDAPAAFVRDDRDFLRWRNVEPGLQPAALHKVSQKSRVDIGRLTETALRV